MKNLYFYFLALIFSLISLLSANGQDILKAEGKVIVNQAGDTILLRGMGLGGWMLQEGYMLQTAGFANAQYQIRDKIEELIGPADTDLFYDAWLDNHVRKIDIDSLKSWGFNSVRLPLHYNLFTLPIEDEPIAGQQTWLDKGFIMTDSLISWCAQNEMWVILDLHAAPGGQGYDQGISDYNPDLPSLWESYPNRQKTAALWKKLAERYKDEPWVAAYDILNEPNWNLPGGVLLRNLYGEITDSIRSVDTEHIIIIEGNWFANDFTGLTPPWDDNLVYGPHKYWSKNETEDIQWVLSIRDEYNVPLYLGESGENSNVWFRDAIKLLEDEGIGWAWWPMKKVESIAGPLSVTKSPEYETLLNYWNGGSVGTPPTAAFAKAALMDLTEKLKFENCFYQKDVIDAMFRQVQSDETKPFSNNNIPGVVYATNYDLGVVGEAYYDKEVATYHVTTSNFTAWNNGWIYRNDGVDIEPCNDPINSNGFNVGWGEAGEWMQYEVNIANEAAYDLKVRYATAGTDGEFNLSIDGADITQNIYAPVTGGWQSWNTFTFENIVLSPSNKKLRFHYNGAGPNLSSFEFIEKGPSNNVPTTFVSAVTANEQTVQLNLNKPLAGPLPATPADFKIYVDGGQQFITDVVLDDNNPRIVYLTVDYSFRTGETIQISHDGTQINATDGTALETFFFKPVLNTIININQIPGRVEAENFFDESGITLETTTDAGGGQNIGYLDVGDYLDYKVNVAETGPYEVIYRTASESSTGQVQLQRIEDNGDLTTLHTVSFPPTGGWQTWQNTSSSLYFTEGQYNLRLTITQPEFNLNWIDFWPVTSSEDLENFASLNVFPNPTEDLFFIDGKLKTNQDISFEVNDLLGRNIFSKQINNVEEFREEIDLSNFPSGNYFVKIMLENGAMETRKLVKM